MLFFLLHTFGSPSLGTPVGPTQFASLWEDGPAVAFASTWEPA